MYSILKRSLDILLSFIAIVCLTPVWLPIIISLLLTGEHLVFYLQERVGIHEKPFFVYKFVTMVKNSEKLGTGTITLRNDTRVLPLGRFLRKTKINELPQLLNIFLGHMSIIGPRPLVPKGFANYNDIAKAKISEMKPGLSGIGSIIFRDEEHIISLAKNPIEFVKEHLQPHKGNLEIWYHEHRSLWVDTMIVFLTVWVVLFPKSELVYKVFPSLPKKDLERAVEKFNERSNV